MRTERSESRLAGDSINPIAKKGRAGECVRATAGPTDDVENRESAKASADERERQLPRLRQIVPGFATSAHTPRDQS